MTLKEMGEGVGSFFGIPSEEEDKLNALGRMPAYRLTPNSYGLDPASAAAQQQFMDQLQRERQMQNQAMGPSVGSQDMANAFRQQMLGLGQAPGQQQLTAYNNANIGDQMSLAASVQGGPQAAAAARQAAQQNITNMGQNSWLQGQALQAQGQQQGMGLYQQLANEAARRQAQQNSLNQSSNLGYLKANDTAFMGNRQAAMGYQDAQANLEGQQNALGQGVIQGQAARDNQMTGALIGAAGSTLGAYLSTRKQGGI